MPSNKNAIARIKVIDRMLSNRRRNFSVQDITRKVNEELAEVDPDAGEVTTRTIQKDIRFIEDQFGVDIERYIDPNAESERTGNPYAKRCLRYAEPDFSIFREKLSEDEKYLLREAISFIGQFDGIPRFETLEKLRLSLDLKHEEQAIISFAKNPLEGKNYIGELYEDIAEKMPVEIDYISYTKGGQRFTFVVSPYLLKEYNRRWYLISAEEKSRDIYNLSLDHILSIKPRPDHKYIEYDGDIGERFEDIIGVTYHPEKPLEDITFWVSDASLEYIVTKPLHESQRKIVLDEGTALRAKNPDLKGGCFFKITCRENYELIRELASFGKELIVLAPTEIRHKVAKWLFDASNIYSEL